MATFNYERAEIDKALKGHPEGEKVAVKFRGADGESRWILATPQQIRAIADILGSDT